MKVKDLHHYDNDVRAFYEQFKGEQVIVGYETSGYARWFEQMLFELGVEVWVGDAAEISRLAKLRQKNDRRDAEHILDLMLKGKFPNQKGLTPSCHLVDAGYIDGDLLVQSMHKYDIKLFGLT